MPQRIIVLSTNWSLYSRRTQRFTVRAIKYYVRKFVIMHPRYIEFTAQRGRRLDTWMNYICGHCMASRTRSVCHLTWCAFLNFFHAIQFECSHKFANSRFTRARLWCNNIVLHSPASEFNALSSLVQCRDYVKYIKLRRNEFARTIFRVGNCLSSSSDVRTGDVRGT